MKEDKICKNLIKQEILTKMNSKIVKNLKH